MKKSVIVLIGIIYLASIFVVGFFGMKVKVYDTMVYITDIECTNEDARKETNGNKTIKFKYDYEGTEDERILKNSKILTYEIFPKNTTLKGKDAVMAYADPEKVVSNIADRNDKTVAVVNDLTISFLKPGVLIVTLKSMDGSNISEVVKIIAY